jgi:hypothetical protein
MAITRINFGEWTPDQPGVTGTMTAVTNTFPLANGYGPILDYANFSNAASENLNSVYAGKSGANTKLFAGGATKLFVYNQTNNNLDDASKSGGYTTPAGERWKFAQFGSVVLAVNGQAKIQAWTLGTSTAFADVAAAAPAAYHVAVVRDFVVAARDDTYPNRVYWSDINDETDWTPGVGSQSDFQDLADGGDIMGMTGGEFGLILTERSVVRMSYIGSPFFFQFDNIARNIGCLASNSIAQYGALTFFLSDDGFYKCDGQSVQAIGTEKVDRFFFEDVNLSQLEFMSAAIDPVKNLVIWDYIDGNNVNKQLIYNWQLNRWSYSDVDVDFINSVYTPSSTLEGLDIFGSLDSLPASLDGRTWVGGALLFAGVRDDKIVTFTGAYKQASLITGDVGIQGSQSVATLAKPLVDNGSASVGVASRLNLDGALTFSTNVAADAEGRVGLRSSGRYHRLRVNPSGNWTSALAVDVDFAPQGNR